MTLAEAVCPVCVADGKKKIIFLVAHSGIWKICLAVSHFLSLSLTFFNLQLFITVMDKLRLEIRAMDEVN